MKISSFLFIMILNFGAVGITVGFRYFLRNTVLGQVLHWLCGGLFVGLFLVLVLTVMDKQLAACMLPSRYYPDGNHFTFAAIIILIAAILLITMPNRYRQDNESAGLKRGLNLFVATTLITVVVSGLLMAVGAGMLVKSKLILEQETA